MPYTLHLTADDVDAIAFVGHRYGWSSSMMDLSEGENRLSEAQAWDIRDGVYSDMEGGHDAFPMLDTTISGGLCEKVQALIDSVV